MSVTSFDSKEFLMNHIRYQSENIEYELTSLLQLIAAAKEIFQAESMLLEFNAPVQIVGDIHGQVSHFI